MKYSIRNLEVFVREMPPDRLPFTVGKSLSAGKRRPRAVWIVRLTLGLQGTSEIVIGRSGDRPSFGWLDKRPDLSPEKKLSDLIALVNVAREIYLERGAAFDSPFSLWLACHREIQVRASAKNHEALSASYASALFERAVIDAVCRAEKSSFFQMVHGSRMGIDFAAVHPELEGKDCLAGFPRRQRDRFFLRHTVGLSDPLDSGDLEKAIGDGEPETLRDYVEQHSLRYFKVKISGDADASLSRLERIWKIVIEKTADPVFTLDGNEAYQNLEEFSGFVGELERQLTGFFQHTLFIEQPLTRALTHDETTKEAVEELSRRKDLVIDEADGTIDSFKNAFAIGYAGASHKNCKGVFKSILNSALCRHFAETSGRPAFLTGEDLSNMSIVPLHQDYDTLSVLGIDHCERNGHHYAYGMSHLRSGEKRELAARHSDLYAEREGELFLRIEGGGVRCGSIFGPGFGGDTMPAWESLTPLGQWTP